MADRLTRVETARTTWRGLDTETQQTVEAAFQVRDAHSKDLIGVRRARVIQDIGISSS